jgi:WD40 repeat protein
MASAGTDATVYFWDVSQHGHPLQLKVPVPRDGDRTGGTVGLAFTPDGETFAVAGADGMVHL